MAYEHEPVTAAPWGAREHPIQDRSYWRLRPNMLLDLSSTQSAAQRPLGWFAHHDPVR